MKRSSNLTVGIAFFVLMGLGTLQGARVTHLREASVFYEWLISASTQVRFDGVVGAVSIADTMVEGEKNDEYKDQELFDRLVEATEERLPEIPLREDLDFDGEGNAHPRLVRYLASHLTESDDSDGAKGTPKLKTAAQYARDKLVWQFAKSGESEALRTDFLTYLAEGKLLGMGSQMAMSDMYADPNAPISVGNMFFGFRKMAANLLWLEVDKLWHKGELYKMVPLMNTTVMLDPTFVDAYLIGAWHLAYNATAGLLPTPWPDKTYSPQHEAWAGQIEELYFGGADFIKDGIRKNPRNYKLYFDLGYAIYEQKLHDLPNAIKYLSEAIRLDHDVWVRRALYRELFENGQFEQAEAGWQSYAEHWPDNAVAPRFVKYCQGATLERDASRQAARANAAEELARRARERAKDGGGVAADADLKRAAELDQIAQEARAVAEGLRQEARELWTALEKTVDGTDVHVVAGLARLDSDELVDEERYDEAIVLLDKARFEAPGSFWDEASDRMIAIKQDAGIELPVTEALYVLRQEEGARYTALLPKSVDGVGYRNADLCWYRSKYDGEELTELEEDSDACLEIICDFPEIQKALTELPGDVVLRAGGQWYRIVSDDVIDAIPIPS
jgi:tetratricopeptide (TPR) repeat protein